MRVGALHLRVCVCTSTGAWPTRMHIEHFAMVPHDGLETSSVRRWDHDNSSIGKYDDETQCGDSICDDGE